MEDIISKVNKGKAWQYGLPAASAALSQVGYHGLLPLGLGVGVGGYVGHGAKKVAELLQNPEVIKVLNKIGRLTK